MAIAFGSAGTQLTVTTAATSFAVPYPSGIAADDLLVLFMSTSGGAVTTPSGWTVIYNETSLANPKGGLWIKKATGSESGTLAVTTASTTGAAMMFRYTGVDATTPQDATATNVFLNATTDPTIDIPSITTATNGAMLVYVGTANSSTVTFTGVDTERVDFGAGRSGALYDVIQATAGASGVKTVTQSAGRAYWGAMMALRPAAGGAGNVAAVKATATAAAGTPLIDNGATGNVAAVKATATALAPVPVVGVAVTPVLNRSVNGIPTTTSMVVKVNTTDATSVRLKIGTNSGLTTGVLFGGAQTPDAEGNAECSVTGLTANTAYFYRVAMTNTGTEYLDVWSTVGEFKTDSGGQLNYSFAFGSCTTATDSDSLAAIGAKKPQLFFHLGDEYYSDGSGTTVANFRTKMNAKKTAANHKLVWRTSGTVMTPSDHDGMNNDTNAGVDATAWTNYNSVYREMNPTTGLPATTGLYRAFTWGRIRYVVLDRRSFATIPSATDDSSKTCLGATQKQWFKDQITNATEPVIIVIQGEPWISSASAGSDAWDGYTTERTELADHITSSGKNVAMIGGDMHALAAEDGSGSPGGVAMFHGSPFYTTSSWKGGPYDVGPYPASGVAATQQYGWIDISDSGSQISLIYKGFTSDDVERITLTKTYTLSAAGNVAAVKATATAAAPVPVVSVPGTVTAVAATATSLARVPVVTSAATVISVIATATSLAPAPTVVGAAVANVAAVKATGTSLAPVPVVSGAATVAGVAATATSLARVPVVTAASTVVGVAATATSLAPAPTVGGAGAVAAVKATATSLAPVPVVSAASTVAGVAATATSAAPAPTLSVGGTVTAVKASGSSLALAPTFSSALVVTAVTATSTAAAPTPTVAGNTGVNAVTATATSAAVAPSLITGNVLSAPTATATATAIAPAVVGGIGTVNGNVLAVAAVGTAAATAPTLTAAANVAGVRATSTATAVAPVASAPATVGAVKATASSAAIVPVVSTAPTVSAVRATATAASVAPVVTVPVSISADRATGAAGATSPAVSAGMNVAAVLAEATASAEAPVASVEVVIAALVVEANASAIAPTMSIEAGLIAVVAIASALARPPLVAIGSATYLKDGTHVQAYRLVGGILVPVEVIY